MTAQPAHMLARTRRMLDALHALADDVRDVRYVHRTLRAEMVESIEVAGAALVGLERALRVANGQSREGA